MFRVVNKVTGKVHWDFASAGAATKAAETLGIEWKVKEIEKIEKPQSNEMYWRTKYYKTFNWKR